MKVTLEHLTKDKQAELDLIKNEVLENAQIEMLILFGSYARGDWVSDKHREGHILYEYQSDFDILAVVKNTKLEQNFSVWNKINSEIKANSAIKTQTNIIVDTIQFINKRLAEGNYFYSDIKKDGIVLYDSGKFTFKEPGTLSVEEQKKLMQRDYSFWLKHFDSYIKDYNHNIADAEFSNAAFHLHQAYEAFLVAILLVYTGYKPKTHNLEKIESLVTGAEETFIGSFKRDSDQAKRLFNILKNAYIDARYKQDFSVAKDDLELLYQKTLELREITVTMCLKRIDNFGGLEV